MKDSHFRILLLAQLLALLLLFPFSPKGYEVIPKLLPSVNYGEDAMLSGLPPEVPAESAQSSVLTDFCIELEQELPGSYILVSVCPESSGIPDELILQLRQWGFPMTLELYSDGTGVLRIFDETEYLSYDPDVMLIRSPGRTETMFYSDSRLRIQDGSTYMIFEKQNTGS